MLDRGSQSHLPFIFKKLAGWRAFFVLMGRRNSTLYCIRSPSDKADWLELIMIWRYNLIQIVLFPIHLLMALGVGYLIIGFCRDRVEWLYTHGDFLLPYALYQRQTECSWVVVVLVFVISTVGAFKIWWGSDTVFPGLLSAVPLFGTNPLRRSSSMELEYVWTSVLFQVFGNILLFCPMQILFAVQRLRNWVPFYGPGNNEAILRNWYQFALEQSRWHSTDLYSDDIKALHYLIRIGKLNYSPAKDLVKAV